MMNAARFKRTINSIIIQYKHMYITNIKENYPHSTAQHLFAMRDNWISERIFHHTTVIYAFQSESGLITSHWDPVQCVTIQQSLYRCTVYTLAQIPLVRMKPFTHAYTRT